MTVDEVEGILRGKPRMRQGIEIRNYTHMIFKMLTAGVDANTIFWYVRRKGFCGTDQTLINAIYRLHNNNKQLCHHRLTAQWDIYKKRYPEDVIVIHRSKLLKYLLTVTEKKLAFRDKLIGEYIDIIREHYPIVSFVEKAFREFHETIMGDDAGKIDTYINSYEDTKLNSFALGLQVDKEAVKNAIIHNVSSGFVEGNNTKFKLVKRALGGRSGIVNLERKTILAFLATTDDFNITEMLNHTIKENT